MELMKMKLQAAFIFLVGDADQTTRSIITTPSIHLQIVGCKNYDEAEIAAKQCVEDGVTAVELCAGFGNEGTARVQKAVGPNITVGAVKFDLHPGLGYQSGDRHF